MTSWLNWTALIYVILPLIFFFLGLLIMEVMSALHKKLPENKLLKILLSKPSRWNNPYWLRDRIDLIFTVFVTLLLIVVTILYS